MNSLAKRFFFFFFKKSESFALGATPRFKFCRHTSVPLRAMLSWARISSPWCGGPVHTVSELWDAARSCIKDRQQERLLTKGRKMATMLLQSRLLHRKSLLSQKDCLEIMSSLTETPVHTSSPCILSGLSSDPRIGIRSDFL